MKKLSKLGKSVLLSSLAVLAFGGVAAGTTYALFTDRQETNVTVTAGKVSLKAQLSDPELYSPTSIDADGTVLDETNAANETAFKNGGTVTIGEDGNVELTNVAPGDKVTFKVALTNASTIKTKYSLTAEVEEGVKNFVKTSFEGYEEGYWYTLDEGATPDEMSLTIEIPTTVTQDQFNGTTDIKLVVNAVQANAKVEKVAVASADELQEALSQKGDVDVVLTEDLDVPETMVVTGDTNAKIELGGHTIANTQDVWNGDERNWSLISVRDNATLTINDTDGTGKFIAKENDCYAVDVFDKAAKVIINGGTFVGNIHAVYVWEGTAEINGGYFDIQQLNNNTSQGPHGLLINCKDENYKAETANIVVRGGKFVEFDPAKNNAEGESIANPTTNFLPKFYKSVHTVEDGKNIYEVMEDVTTSEIAKDGSIYDATLGEGKNVVSFPAEGGTFQTSDSGSKFQNKYIEFVGNGASPKDTVLKTGHTTQTPVDWYGDYNFEGSEVSFENLTIADLEKNRNYAGFIRAKSLSFKNCIFSSRISYWGIGDVNFENCVFEETGEYNLWTWSGETFNFKNCSFYTGNGAINAYKGGHDLALTTINFDGCKFFYTGTGLTDKTPVAVGEDKENNQFCDSNLYEVNFNDVTIDEKFATKPSTNAWRFWIEAEEQKLVLNKDKKNPDHLKVTYNGKKVEWQLPEGVAADIVR